MASFPRSASTEKMVSNRQDDASLKACGEERERKPEGSGMYLR